MSIRRNGRGNIIKNFKKNLKTYYYMYPYYRDINKKIDFNSFNYDYLCLARLLGVNVFREICPYASKFNSKESNFDIGQENFCNGCVYNIRIDYCENNMKKPKIKIACDERLIEEIQKGFYGDYSKISRRGIE